MWAFEAEQRGASMVVATDCQPGALGNFLLCREVLRSQVLPFYNVSPYNLHERLDCFTQRDIHQTQDPRSSLFDIVQHFGVFYHLRDPLMSLSQARNLMREGGTLILETAAIANETRGFSLFNGVPRPRPGPGYWYRLYDDPTTWWAPTVPCLREMLRATFFETVGTETHAVHQNWNHEVGKTDDGPQYDVSRVTLIARAVSPDVTATEHRNELIRAYRNPGMAELTHDYLARRFVATSGG